MADVPQSCTPPDVPVGYALRTADEAVKKDYQMARAMQELFVEMLLGVRSTTQTRRFCTEAHGSGYEDIVTYRQMDAQEFYITALSALEAVKRHRPVVAASEAFTIRSEVSITSACGHVVLSAEHFSCCPLDLADRACDSRSVVADARQRFPRALRRAFIGSFFDFHETISWSSLLINWNHVVIKTFC